MKEEILNTIPVQGHFNTSLCTADPLPAAHPGQVAVVGSSPQTSPCAPCPVSSWRASNSQGNLTILKYIPQSSRYWTEISFLLLLPSQPSSHSVPQDDNTSTCPHAGVFFPVTTGGGAVGTTPETAPHPRGAWERRHAGFLSKNHQTCVYHVHQDSGTCLGFFFFPFTRINSLKHSHYSICCTTSCASCLPTHNFQWVSNILRWMPRTWWTWHTNTNQ